MPIHMLKNFFCKRALWLTGLFFIFPLLVSYHKIFDLWYQQDEWAALGSFLSGDIQAYIGQYTLIQMLTGTGRLLSLVFHYPFFRLFPFQVWPFALISLLFHFLNSLLVFVFAYHVIRRYFFAFLSALFFLVSSVSSQAVTWFASSATTLPSATFLLLSLILALQAANKRNMRLFIWSQLCAIVSFLFKESGIIAFILAPYLYIFWNQKRIAVKSILVKLTPLLSYGILIAGVHLYRILTAPVIANSPFVENSPYVWQKLFIHAVQYPLVSLSQLFIPQKIMFKAAAAFQTINYSHLERFTASQLGVESIVSDFVSFILSVVIIACSVWLAYRVAKYRKYVLLSICFILISFLPFIVLDKQTAYLESRYFYNGAIGGGLLFASVLLILREILKRTGRVQAYVVACFLGFVVIGFLWKHIQYIQRDLNVLAIESSERIHFFTQLNRILPHLHDSTVLYVTGTNYGYYGIQELKIPLQQGPGFTFMVWYWRDGVIPRAFIRDYFLWRVESEGYRTLGDKSFGYYHDLSVLKQEIFRGIITPSQVIGLSYDTDTKKLRDITAETRLKLE